MTVESGPTPWRGYDTVSADPDELDRGAEFDVVVVGAGLVGLATAREILRRQPETSIAILDGVAPAAGASGRGTGLVGPRIGPGIDVLERRFGSATALRSYRASERAVEITVALCRELDVEVAESAQYVIARTAAEERMLFAQMGAYRRLGVDVLACSRRGLADVTATPVLAGLAYRSAAMVDPARLTTALARRVASLGAGMYHGVPVSDVGLHGGRVRVQTGRGAVAARSVIVATNVPTIPSVARRVGGIAGFTVFGAATSGSAVAGPAERVGSAFIGADPLAPFHATRPDGSTTVGGGGARSSIPGSVVPFDITTWNWLERWARITGAIGKNAELGYRWSGPIAVTADGLPVVGPVEGMPGVWFMGGCGGHGLAMSAYNAGAIADAVSGPGGRLVDLPWMRSRAPGPRASKPVRAAVGGYIRVRTLAMRRAQSAAPVRTTNVQREAGDRK